MIYWMHLGYHSGTIITIREVNPEAAQELFDKSNRDRDTKLVGLYRLINGIKHSKGKERKKMRKTKLKSIRFRRYNNSITPPS
jgi:hypothetical protein